MLLFTYLLKGYNRIAYIAEAQQTHTMWSIRGMSSPFLLDKNAIGIVLCNIGNFCFTNPMTCSTWIQTLAILLLPESWNVPELCQLTQQC